MSRPAHLPDYKRPPLNEVVLGVQFSPPKSYQQIYAGEVRELFRQDFPKVQQQIRIEPAFETFGRPQSRSNVLERHIIQEFPHPRYWFLSEDGDELIQFQQDRLLHNWRKVGIGENPYPHFENILPKFENELLTLEKYLEKLSDQKMNITQCELTYINLIPLTEEENGTSGDKWIDLVNFSDLELDDFTFRFRKNLNDETGHPYGRLIGDCKTAINQKDKTVLVLELTVRGAPKEPSISASLDFLKTGREIIVNCFDNITTEFAHRQWEKK